MKKCTILIFIVLLIITSAFLSISSSRETKTRQITGQVISIDEKTLTVKKKDRVITVNVKEGTRIIECKEKNSLKDLKVGDKVTVRYKDTKTIKPAKEIIIK
jgi:Cu/Ag efflux protein CusF